MNQEKRDEIWDKVDRPFPIVDADEDVFPVVRAGGGTLRSWGDALGHDINEALECRTCGKGGPCTFIAFYDAAVSSVVRALDKAGSLVPTDLGKTMYPEDMRGPVTWCGHADERHGPEMGCIECRCIAITGHGKGGAFWEDLREEMKDPEFAKEYERVSTWMAEKDATVSADMCPNCKGDNEEAFELCSKCSHRSEDDWRNDPFNLWGSGPSYRCYMTRHNECDPEGPEKGCTCACGHQEPTCACSTRVLDEEGKLVHAAGCPQESIGTRYGREMRAKLSPEAIEAIRTRLADGTAPVRKVKVRVQPARRCEFCDGPLHNPKDCPEEPSFCDHCRGYGHSFEDCPSGDAPACGPVEPCGWFTDPYGLRRHGIEQGPPGTTDFKPCHEIKDPE